MNTSLRRVVSTLLLFLAGACVDANEDQPGRVVLIGVDGLEWDVCLPLLRAGRMPHLEELMERGSFGLLDTLVPTQSPVIWTTIATGKTRDEHGIRGFSKPARKNRARELFTNRDRRTKAVWNIAGEHDKRVGVVGWWMTRPVEPVNGVMVAQTNTVDQLQVARGKHVWKGALIPGESGQVYPAERELEVLGLLAATEAGLDGRLEEIFGEFEHPLSLLGERLWSNCRWAFRADATYARIAEELMEKEPFDLFCVYFGGPDVVGHRFWRYREPELYAHRPDAAQIENFGTIVDDYYVYVDELIGRLVAAAGPRANVVVLSDHGMQAINMGARFDPNDPPIDVNSAHHYEAPAGVIVAAGPDVIHQDGGALEDLRRADLVRKGSVLDIAKTVLCWLDLPLGEDMRGEPATGLVSASFLAEHPVRTVPTHDTEEWIAAHAELMDIVPDAARIEQLRALGYLGEEGDLLPEVSSED